MGRVSKNGRRELVFQQPVKDSPTPTGPDPGSLARAGNRHVPGQAVGIWLDRPAVARAALSAPAGADAADHTVGRCHHQCFGEEPTLFDVNAAQQVAIGHAGGTKHGFT